MCENGWFPGRRIDDARFDLITKTLGEYHFELFDAAEAILREFGDLNIKQSGKGSVEVSPGICKFRETFDFNPLYETVARPEYVPYIYISEYIWGQHLGRRVYPIGNVNQNCYDAILVVDDLGKVYVIADGNYLVGNSIDEMLENMVSSAPFITLENFTFDEWNEKIEAEKQRRENLKQKD